MSTGIHLPIYSMAFRIPLDRAAAPHMVQITEIAVIYFPSFALMPPLYQSRCPKIGTLPLCENFFAALGTFSASPSSKECSVKRAAERPCTIQWMFFMMKRLFVSFLAFVMVLSLAACGQQKPDTSDVDLTAPEVLGQLKTALGGTYGCDTADDEDWMTNYYGLDMSKIDSWASESCSISSIDPSTAVVLRVKDGYALDAAGESDWFLSEAKKVDAAWSDIFGTAENQIVP